MVSGLEAGYCFRAMFILSHIFTILFQTEASASMFTVLNCLLKRYDINREKDSSNCRYFLLLNHEDHLITLLPLQDNVHKSLLQKQHFQVASF